MHTGMSYARLKELGGIQWPCPDEEHPGSEFLHGRLWDEPVGGPLAPFSVTPWAPPIDELDDDFPIRLTTGRRLDSYNTGVQSGLYRSPMRRGETLDLCAQDAASLDVEPGEIVRITSRRGSIEAPVRLDPGLRPGLAFMTMHFPDEIDVNILTIDSTDPKSGTAEFKATAIRVEKVRERQTAGVTSSEAGGSSVDVRLLDAEPTAAERDAVDAFLGPSLAAWSGTDAIENGHAAHGGHAARAQRHMLLPTLHALHERAGWISPGGLNYVAQRLTVPPADVYGVATFYALFSTEERPPRVVHVCDDVACRCAGSEALIASSRRASARRTPTSTARRGCAARAWASATARRRRC